MFRAKDEVITGYSLKHKFVTANLHVLNSDRKLGVRFYMKCLGFRVETIRYLLTSEESDHTWPLL